MGASIALASTTACTRNPLEHIVPYQKQPEEMIPGKPLYYATALTLGGYARGVLVETHEGRPTKIEGNPEHPASLGASDVFMQAELLTLYDPERSQAVMHKDQISTWDLFLGEMAAVAERAKADRGAGLRILTRHETSPTFLDQLARLREKFPEARWHEYEPLASAAPRARYDFEKADVIVSLGGDFLRELHHARAFSKRRRSNESPPRLYVAESTPTLTGAMADHRLVLKPSELEEFAQLLVSENHPIASDLRRSAGRSLVLVGDEQPTALHHFARALNNSLGNTDVTVVYERKQRPVAADLTSLSAAIDAGKVETLLILGGNPVYDAPADSEFAAGLAKVPRVVHFGLYQNETAAGAHWHVPEAHALESWSDARAFDNAVTIMQPMIEPLLAGHSRHEVLSALLEEPPSSAYEIVRGFWAKQDLTPDFEKWWRKALHDGSFIAPLPLATAALTVSNFDAPAPGPRDDTLNLLIRPSARLYDGSYANNAWLQELPDPLTSIVWDNAALISPVTAARLGLTSGDVVDLKFHGRSVPAPIWIQPGQADDCVTVHLGYGRSRAGSVGNDVGFNAYTLRDFQTPWGGHGLEISKTGKRHAFATTQEHWKMEGRDLVRAGAAGEPPPRDDETLYPPVAYIGHAWGMVIDLDTCIGCGVCTIACQAENNIPVVGKEQVARGREMHWIRVDRYFENEAGLTNPRILYQPVPCMHCENAPCELVCPVAATVHSSEGLNQMVYNRCIGTRYCSNNCPYKVRRFNFLEYDANQFEQRPTRKLMRNPDVTVRTRGVMEKCTYCIQRINIVKIDAEKANRAVRDGEITPACAQACPADAIIFGDINDANSRVAKLRASPRNYGLLAELNTRPRTTYLAKLRNPNPAMENA